MTTIKEDRWGLTTSKAVKQIDLIGYFDRYMHTHICIYVMQCMLCALKNFISIIAFISGTFRQSVLFMAELSYSIKSYWKCNQIYKAWLLTHVAEEYHVMFMS